MGPQFLQLEKRGRLQSFQLSSRSSSQSSRPVRIQYIVLRFPRTTALLWWQDWTSNCLNFPPALFSRLSQAIPPLSTLFLSLLDEFSHVDRYKIWLQIYLVINFTFIFKGGANSGSLEAGRRGNCDGESTCNQRLCQHA